nr:exportin-2 [Cryptomonas paramecium]
MMKKIETSYKILTYFFGLVSIGFSDNRFYSENFLFKTKNIRGIFFLFIKILSCLNLKNHFTKHFVIFLKNIVGQKKFSTKTCFFALNYLVNIFLIIPKMFNEASYIFLFLFKYNVKCSSIVNFLFINLIKKFLFKINYKKYTLQSIIFVLYNVFSTSLKSKHILITQYSKILQSIITKLFFVIANCSKIDYLRRIRLKYIKYLVKLFKNINYYYLFYEEKNLYNWIIVFFFILNIYSNDFDSKKKIAKLKFFILNILYKICYHYHDKFFIYLPILCKLILKFPYKKKKKFKNSIEILILINAIDKSIMNSNNNFKKKFEILLLQIISNHTEMNGKLKYCSLYIFSRQNFNFQSRIKCTSDLVNSILFQKEDINFFLKTSSDCKLSILYCLHISFFTFYTIFYLINFSHTKGIRVTYYIIKRTKFLHEILFEYFKNFEMKKKESIYFDFFSLFSYQSSVKILSRIFFACNFVCSAKNLAHQILFIKYILDIKGSNKEETIMWYNNMLYQKNIFLYTLIKLKENEISFINNVYTKSLFMKIVLRSLQKKKIHKPLFRLWILSILEFFLQNENQLEFQYDFEILNIMINCLIKTENINFLHNIYKDLFYISNDQISNFPYFLDIFSIALVYNKSSSNVKFFVQIFRNLFNPHLWCLKFLIKPMINYLKIFNASKFYKINEQEFRSICCIIQLIDWDSLEKSHFLSFLLNFLNIINEKEKFLIHFVELFLGNENQLLLKNRKNFFSFLILLYRIGTAKMFLVFKKIHNKIASKMIRVFFHYDLFTYDIKLENSLFFFLFFLNRILTRVSGNLIKMLFRQNLHIIKMLQNKHNPECHVKNVRIKVFSKSCTNSNLPKSIFVLNKIIQYNVLLFFRYNL